MSRWTQQTTEADRWIRCLSRDNSTAALFNLLCFPSAGTGASSFNDWVRGIGPEIALFAVKLPGRENRIREPFAGSMRELVESLIPALTILNHRPMVFFGHSFGALLAFETIRSLRAARRQLPVRLFVSGCGAPQWPFPQPRIAHASDSELADQLRQLNGIPPAVTENPDYFGCFLPAIRADLTLWEAYRYEDAPHLSCPITAFAGEADPRVPVEDVAGWSEQTAAHFSLEVFAGGHFFISTARDQILNEIRSKLGVTAEVL
jgi:medium-chain acyl-[acyl-carrier-protein] hydrolase